MIVPSLTSLDVEGEVSEETTYFHDAYGYVIKEIKHDYSDDSEITKEYRYEFSFY